MFVFSNVMGIASEEDIIEQIAVFQAWCGISKFVPVFHKVLCIIGMLIMRSQWGIMFSFLWLYLDAWLNHAVSFLQLVIIMVYLFLSCPWNCRSKCYFKGFAIVIHSLGEREFLTHTFLSQQSCKISRHLVELGSPKEGIIFDLGRGMHFGVWDSTLV